MPSHTHPGSTITVFDDAAKAALVILAAAQPERVEFRHNRQDAGIGWRKAYQVLAGGGSPSPSIRSADHKQSLSAQKKRSRIDPDEQLGRCRSPQSPLVASASPWARLVATGCNQGLRRV
jgi:hypothetical protein